jgi:hypothetical protein
MHRLALTVSILFLTLVAYAASDQEPGVENGDCFSDSSGHESEVAVKGMMFGNQKVTVTETTTTTNDDGTTTTTTSTGSTEEATPSAGGGCEESEEFSVGDSEYKVDNGKLKRKNSEGKWITQSEGTCGDDDTNAQNGDELGSLP